MDAFLDSFPSHQNGFAESLKLARGTCIAWKIGVQPVSPRKVWSGNNPVSAKVHWSLLKGRLLLALGLVLAILSTKAAEPILTLAMVKTDSAFDRHVRVRENLNSSRLTPKPALPNEGSPTFFRRIAFEQISISAPLMLEKRPEPTARNPLQFSRATARNSETKLWASASLQAGYGEVYLDKTPAIYGHNGTGWQEPSCGYVKFHIRF